MSAIVGRGQRVSEQGVYREFDGAAVVDAFRQTEIIPVRRTWALFEPKTDPATGTMRPVPCGCALVALARAVGVDPVVIFQPGDRAFASNRDVVGRYARVLGCDPEHARGIEEGWDAHTEPLDEDTPYARGYRAGRDAWEEVMG